MIKLLYEDFNDYDIIELFYDKSNCNYILVVNNEKTIIKNVSDNNKERESDK